MNLVIGGAYQGKTKAACTFFKKELSDFVDGRSCSMEEIFSASGIHHFHEYVRRMILKEISAEGFGELLFKKNPDLLVVSDEIGYGLVPMEAMERAWREQTGRICCVLAQNSDIVVRVTAGIPSVIKGK